MKDFLVEHGLASARGHRIIPATSLLTELRNRDVANAATAIAKEIGLTPRRFAQGARVTGVYRRSLMLTSGRFALLDDGLGFSLVPWRRIAA